VEANSKFLGVLLLVEVVWYVLCSCVVVDGLA
jgi:hypothetical protein